MPASPLFRQEVLDHHGERLWGDLIGSRSVTGGLLALFFAVVTLLAAIFLLQHDYKRKQQVAGVLTPDRGIIAVNADTGGIVSGVAVKLGDSVRKGQLLFSLQGGNSFLAGQSPGDHLLGEITRQQVALERALERTRERYMLNRRKLVVKRMGLETQQAKLTAILAGEETRVALLQKKYARLQALQGKGLLAAADLDTAQAELLAGQGNLEQTRLSLARLENDFADIGGQLALLALEREEALATQRNELAELNKQAIQWQAKMAVDILAPADGTVTLLTIKPGQALQANRPALSLMPAGATLQAELFLPSSAMGFLREGQSLNIRYDAFPYQKFGTQQASVSSISQTVLNAPGENREPYYRVTARLDRQFVPAFGIDQSLLPGMRLEADVILESRSLMEWLLEPLFSIRGWHAG